MLAIYKRELKSYLTSMYGFLFMFLMLLFTGFSVWSTNLLYGYADISYALAQSELILIIAIPVLCMKSLASDMHNKTDMFLRSLPIKTADIVLGKYLALLTVFALPTLIIALYPVVLGFYGEVNYLSAYTALLGFFLLGAALIAVCQFLSSLTENVIVAAVLSIIAVLAMYFMYDIAYVLPKGALASFISFVIVALLVAVAVYFGTKNVMIALVTAAVIIIPLLVLYILFGASFEALFPRLLLFISPFVSFQQRIISGLLDLAAVATLLSYVVFFVFLTHQSVDKKRWS